MTISPLATIALAALLLQAGHWARAHVAPIRRLNLPAPVVGGLAAAIVMLAIKQSGAPAVTFTPVLQQPLMIAFFTTLGFIASIRLLRLGGAQVILLLAAASVLAVLQGLLGASIAAAFGLKPLLGFLTGTATLSGGPATGLAFAPQFEQAGIAGASAIAVACGMAGIVVASLAGAPLATWLIERKRVAADAEPAAIVQDDPAEPASPPEPHGAIAATAMKTVLVILLAMWLGGLVSEAIQAAGITLPPYVGAMIIAAVIRNLDDATGLIRLPVAAIELVGTVALGLFLVLAMMTLDLSLLAGLALPLIVNLLLQLLLVVLVMLGPVWWLMGRDYEGAVASGGFAGFMLGTTANSLAIMHALVERYGGAPRAFLAVPLVGAFFLDFVNTLILSVALNLFG